MRSGSGRLNESEFEAFESLNTLKFNSPENQTWNTFRTVRSSLKKIADAGNYHWAVVCTEIESSEYEDISNADTVKDFRYFKVGFKIILEEELENEVFCFDMYADVQEILRDSVAGKYKFKVPKEQSTISLQCFCRMYRYNLEDDRNQSESDSANVSVTSSDDKVYHEQLPMSEQSSDEGIESPHSDFPVSTSVSQRLSDKETDNQLETRKNYRHYTQYLIMYAVNQIKQGRYIQSTLLSPKDFIELATRVRNILMETRDAVKAHYFANLLVFAIQNNFAGLLSDCCETFAAHLSLMNYQDFWEVADMMEPCGDDLKRSIIRFLCERSFSPIELYEFFRNIFDTET